MLPVARALDKLVGKFRNPHARAATNPPPAADTAGAPDDPESTNRAA
jgi:hypothetical protein